MGAAIPPTRTDLFLPVLLLFPHQLQKYGGIDILVSNAAVNPGAGPLAETSPDVIDKILDINVKVRLVATVGGHCAVVAAGFRTCCESSSRALSWAR